MGSTCKHQFRIKLLKNPHAVTQTDVAKASGVSRQLVSVILKQTKPSRKRYSEATKKKVLETAKQLGYRPNHAARSLQGGRHQAIGLILDNMGMLPPALFSALLKRLGEQGFILLVGHCSGLEEAKKLRLIKEQMVDALIFFETLSPGLQDFFSQLKLPVLTINGESPYAGASIFYDENQGMALSVEKLINAGKTDIAVIGTQHEVYPHYSTHQRELGFKKACKQAGLKAHKTLIMRDCVLVDSIEQHGNKIHHFLQKNDTVDGIILMTDTLAPAFYHAAKTLKKHIPQKCSVITFNNGLLSQGMDPPVSALWPEPKAVCEALIEALEHLLKNNSNPSDRIHTKTLPYSFIARISTKSNT